MTGLLALQLLENTTKPKIVLSFWMSASSVYIRLQCTFSIHVFSFFDFVKVPLFINGMFSRYISATKTVGV